MRLSTIGVGVGLVLLAALLRWQLVLPDAEWPADHAWTVAETGFVEGGDNAPATLYRSEEARLLHFGRWLRPIADPRLVDLTVGQRLVQQKAWHFLALVVDGRWLVGLATADLGYLGVGIGYVFDAHTGAVNIVNPQRLFGLSARPSLSSVRGCSSAGGGTDLALTICSAPGNHLSSNATLAWNMKSKLFFSDGSIGVIEATIRTDAPALALSYPIGPSRPAYTHKSSGMTAEGILKLRNAEQETVTDVSFSNGVALMDWTRSLHRRLTVWFWVALTWRTESGRRVGINLSHGVYPRAGQADDSSSQAGLENGIWIDDTLTLVDAPLTVQGRPGGEVQVGKQWSCSASAANYSLQLTFTPQHVVHSSENVLGIVYGDLRHTLGTYSGRLSVGDDVFHIDRLPGILEDHYALW